MSVEGWKVLTHDFRPPVQGGSPVWDGKRKTLDRVTLDAGPDECAAGWNFCADAHTALRIAGLWPDGRPSVLLRVRGSDDTIVRGDKLRCSRLTILERADETVVRDAVARLSEPFGDHRERMVASQMLWRAALARPGRDEGVVVAGLRAALGARGLRWKLCRYDTAGAAWAPWDVRSAWDAWATWDPWDPWDVRSAWDAWATWDARDARAAWAAWAPWDVRSAWDAWDARDARDALTVEYAALNKWTAHDPLLLTTGLRDAYQHGLAIAVPAGKDTLGWAMEPA